MRPAPLYNLIGILSAPVLYGLYRLRARGKENLPQGGFVLACNHISSLDPWVLGMPLWPRRFLRFMAKSELYWPPLKYVLNGVGAFPVRRGQRDVQAIETAVQREPINPLFLRDAGSICKRAGLTAKAERYLEEALKWDTDNPEIRAALAELRQRGEAKEGGKGFTLFKKG